MDEEEDGVALESDTGMSKRIGDGMVESPMAEEGDSSVEDEPVVGEDESDVGEGGRRLNARTYVIAVQLYFELEGKDAEFEALSRRLPTGVDEFYPGAIWGREAAGEAGRFQRLFL